MSYNSDVWKGTNIHAYTPDVLDLANRHVKEMTDEHGDCVGEVQFVELLSELKGRYGEKIAYQNFRNVYDKVTGRIVDHELPSLNVAVLLKATWGKVKRLDDESLYRHFGETLDQIGMTCIVGISHRLLIDHVALGGCGT